MKKITLLKTWLGPFSPEITFFGYWQPPDVRSGQKKTRVLSVMRGLSRFTAKIFNRNFHSLEVVSR